MKKIRILIANHPRMMREIVREILEAQPDMEVVDEISNPVDLLVAIRDTNADAVILGLKDSEEPGLTSHLLNEYPDLTIVGLASNGKTAFVRPGRHEIAHPSEAQILTALRQSVQAPRIGEEEVVSD